MEDGVSKFHGGQPVSTDLGHGSMSYSWSSEPDTSHCPFPPMNLNICFTSTGVYRNLPFHRFPLYFGGWIVKTCFLIHKGIRSGWKTNMYQFIHWCSSGPRRPEGQLIWLRDSRMFKVEMTFNLGQTQDSFQTGLPHMDSREVWSIWNS